MHLFREKLQRTADVALKSKHASQGVLAMSVNNGSIISAGLVTLLTRACRHQSVICICLQSKSQLSTQSVQNMRHSLCFFA